LLRKIPQDDEVLRQSAARSVMVITRRGAA
jgi:hypothetical protein